MSRPSSMYGKEKVYIKCLLCGANLYELNGQPGVRYEIDTDQDHKCPRSGQQGEPGKTPAANIG